MAKITFDDLLKKIPNKYMLTIVSGKRSRDKLRARQQEQIVEEETFEKRKTIVQEVMEEIKEGRITPKEFNDKEIAEMEEVEK